jgi:hypothetical protein
LNIGRCFHWLVVAAVLSDHLIAEVVDAILGRDERR